MKTNAFFFGPNWRALSPKRRFNVGADVEEFSFSLSAEKVEVEGGMRA